MPNPASVDVKDRLLQESGLGLAFPPAVPSDEEWGLAINQEPDSPNRVVTLYDLSGRPPAFCMDPAVLPYEFFMLQVRVRALSMLSAAQQCQSIATALNQMARWTVTGSGGERTRYDSVKQLDAVHFLEKTERNRFIYVTTFQVSRRVYLVGD
jgi:hypothetical protein